MDELSLLAKHSKMLICWGIWVNPLALAFPLQLSLANTRMCALSSVLVMNVNWIPINWQLWRDIELRPRANVCSFSMAKVVWCSAHSCSDLQQATWFLVATGVLEALKEQHWTQGLRCLPNSSFPSLQYCEGDTLHRSDPWQNKSTWDWCELDCCMNATSIGKTGKDTLCIDLTLCENGNFGENVSTCVPFQQYWWSIWTGQLHECRVNWHDRQDIELGSKGQCPFFQHGKSSMLGNVIPGSDKIPGSLNTSASATKAHPNTRSQVSAKLKLSQPSTLWRRHPSSIWSLARLKLWSEWFSHSGHRLTPACVPFRKYLGLMWTGLLHERHINWQDWQGHTLHWSDPLQERKLWRDWFSHSGDCLTPACVISVWYWRLG